MTIEAKGPAVARPLRILLLEDSPLDAELIQTSLADGGIACVAERVQARAEFLAALGRGCFDLILADYSLPSFDGVSALELAHAACPEVPFLFVSGALGEELAIETLKRGATDYVLKNHLERLVPSIRRALREADERAERRRAEQDLRRAKEEAVAANRAKDDFLAVLSHELRTPLTPVLAAVTALRDDPETPESIRPMLAMAARNVELEARLIDDLLDVTRISQGKLRLVREGVDVHDLAMRALDICRPDFEPGGLALRVDLEAREHHVEADPARLQQVVWNLIKNAVKFTPPGGTIAIRTRNEADPNSERPRLLVEVVDSGVGIEPEALHRIFDAFEQGGEPITRRFGGLGLGLAISRSIAAMHGGRLSAASQGPGRGATFTLEIPTIPKPATVPTASPAPIGDRAPGRPLRVLFVEDNEDTARVMGRLLAGNGHDVRIAHSVAAALLAAEEGPFDLLISDLGLPDGSGLDLMRQIRDRRPIPGIALSGYGRDEDLRNSREAGFSSHLIKPIDFARLEALIREVVAQAEGQL